MITLPLRDILSHDPISVGTTAPIVDVLSLMHQRHISCVLAVDGDGKPAGIFTEQDAVALMASKRNLSLIDMASIMHRPVFTAPVDMDYRDAYRQMSTHGFRHLAAVDTDGRLVGIITEGDFLHHLGMEYLVEMKSVSSAMTPSPLTLPESASLADGVQLLATQHASCVLITRDKMPIGILTERDLVHLARQGLDQTATPITSAMHAPVLSVTPDYPLQEAIRQMELASVRQLAVVDATGLVGLISRHEIVKALQGRYIEYLQETIHRQRVDFERIQQQDAQLKLQIHALNAAANAIVITDTEPRILWANAAFCALTGYSPEEAIGSKPAELVSSGKQDPSYYREMWSSILAGRVWRGELVNKRKDGSLYDEELTITPVCLGEPSNQISHFIAVKQDITERKQVERNLRESEAHFRLFYEHAPVAYHSCDESGQILDVNQAWQDQLGYPRDQVIGRFIGDFLVAGQVALLRERFKTFLRDGSIQEADYDFLHQDGSIVTIVSGWA